LSAVTEKLTMGMTMKNVRNILSSGYWIMMVSLLGAGMSACTSSNGELIQQKIMAGTGIAEPVQPVIVRSKQKVVLSARQVSSSIPGTYDFSLQVDGREMTGKHHVDVTLEKEDGNKLIFINEKQEPVHLYYQLSKGQKSLVVTGEQKNIAIDQDIRVDSGALKKHVIVSGEKDILLALLTGGSKNPFSKEFNGVQLVQMIGQKNTSTKTDNVSYIDLPVRVSYHGVSRVVKPGDEYIMNKSNGLKVRVIESLMREMNTESQRSSGYIEGPTYHYRIAIFR